MPFRALLKQLVSSVEGATGAIVVEADGEAVQWHTAGDGEKLRLRGAYAAVMLQAARASAPRMGPGKLVELVIEYEGASFVVADLDGCYFVLLELTSEANIGQALYRIGPAAADLRRALTA